MEQETTQQNRKVNPSIALVSDSAIFVKYGKEFKQLECPYKQSSPFNVINQSGYSRVEVHHPPCSINCMACKIKSDPENTNGGYIECCRGNFEKKFDVMLNYIEMDDFDWKNATGEECEDELMKRHILE